MSTNDNSANSANRADNSTDKKSAEKDVLEKNLEKMEALLRHSALGVHVLFENACIARVLKGVKDDKDFFDFNKMKRVQDCMTELIAKKTILDKMAYLKDLDQEAYDMLIRTYFHIVENNVRQSSELSH